MEQGLLNFSAPRKVYFQTTRLTAGELDQAVKNAERQDEAVLAIFRAYAALTPSDCHEHYQRMGKPAPLTSIRRSITVLTSAGALVKTDDQRTGLYGSPEHVWRLAA